MLRHEVQDKDLRGALQAAKEVLDRANPEGAGDVLEPTTSIVVRYVWIWSESATLNSWRGARIRSERLHAAALPRVC